MKKPILESEQRGKVRSLLNALGLTVTPSLFNEIRNGPDLSEANPTLNNRVPEHTRTMKIMDVSTPIRKMIRGAQSKVIAAE